MHGSYHQNMELKELRAGDAQEIARLGEDLEGAYQQLAQQRRQALDCNFQENRQFQQLVHAKSAVLVYPSVDRFKVGVFHNQRLCHL